MISVGGSSSPAKAATPPRDPAQPRAEDHRQIDDVGPGQEMAEREGFVELVRRHPAVLLDDRPPGEHQNSAETSQGHPGEGHKQRGQAGRRAAGRGTIRLLGGRC
ncbi:hypothetical protein ABIE87_003952 [Bradyrhizobium diazoefficiens]